MPAVMLGEEEGRPGGAAKIAYLHEASKLGDRLFVAVNDDDSAKRLKGEERPINTLALRMEVLAALDFVDGCSTSSIVDVVRQQCTDDK